jgi:hypothetical protein
VTPIRPQLPQTLVPAKPAADARSAFFQAVRGTGAVQPTASAQTQSRPQPPALAPARVQIQTDAPAPTRHLRPGSLLDIKV